MSSAAADRVDGVATDRTTRKLQAFAGLLFVLLYLAPLGFRPLSIPDETRYAEIPREMLVSGDWTVPRADGFRYFEKPVLGYWVSCLTIGLLGENAFAVRLPTALSAGGTALVVYWLGLVAFRCRRTACLAAIAYLGTLQVVAIGTFAVLDGVLAFFLTLGIALVHAASLATEDRKARLLWLGAGASFGGAFLTKGFLAFAVPGMVLVAWALWDGRLKLLLTRGWLSVAAVLVVAGPWALAIHLREPDFWHDFFWVEHVKRFAAENAQHAQPPWFYLLALPATAFPWLGYAAATAAGLWQARSEEAGRSTLRLLLLWMVLPFAFFSVSRGKLITYVLPCLAPLALLTARGLVEYGRRGGRRLLRWGAGFDLACLSLVLLLMLAVASGLVANFAEPSDLRCGRLLAVALAAGVALALATWRRGEVRHHVLGGALLLAPFMFVIHSVLPARALEATMPAAFLQEQGERIRDDAVIVSEGSMVLAVCWYLRRDDVLLTSASEFRYGIERADSRHRLLGPEDLRALVDDPDRDRPLVVFCRRGCPEGIGSALPAGAERAAWGAYEAFHLPAN